MEHFKTFEDKERERVAWINGDVRIFENGKETYLKDLPQGKQDEIRRNKMKKLMDENK